MSIYRANSEEAIPLLVVVAFDVYVYLFRLLMFFVVSIKSTTVVAILGVF